MALLAVYAVFFTVQLTSYFDHRSGSTYRLSSDAFHAPKPVKQVAHGFSNSDAAGKKISIRLNKKFQPQSAVLYTEHLSASESSLFAKQLSISYSAPFTTTFFLLNHSLRGPPAGTCA
ncbi:MAG: hypothetical protein V4539_07935 [Bacteroidota bacterium]